MRQIGVLYLVLLAFQYSFNPFVPAPRELAAQRHPQGVAEEIITPLSPFPIHRDELGLIVQANGDGGDTAQRTGMFYYVTFDPKGFARALDQLEVAPGIYVRHPRQPGLHSDPRRFSRDQQRPIIIALGKYRMFDRLARLATQHVLRLGKYQNLDLIGPVGIGEYIRAFDFLPLYPCLLVTDAFLFLGSMNLVMVAAFDPDESDDNNHIMTLLQARDVMPTPFGWLAMKAYQTLRPENLGNSVLGKDDPVHGALAWYHRAESGGNPALGDAIYQAVADQ